MDDRFYGGSLRIRYTWFPEEPWAADPEQANMEYTLSLSGFNPGLVDEVVLGCSKVAFDKLRSFVKETSNGR